MIKKVLLILSLVSLICLVSSVVSSANVRVELTSKIKPDTTFVLEAAVLIETFDIPIESDSIQLGIEFIVDNIVTIEYLTVPKFDGFIIFSKFFTHLKSGKHNFRIRICPTMIDDCKEGAVNFELKYSDINDIRPLYSRMSDIYRSFDDTLEVELTGLTDSVEVFLDNSKLDDVDLKQTQYFIVNVSQLPFGKHILKVKSNQYEKKFEFNVPFSLLRLIKTDYKKGLEALKPLVARGNVKMYNVFNEMYTKHEFSDSLFDEFWSNSDISYTDYQNLMIIADFQFACFGEPGWSTDMGKTFLTWGSPDEINKYENDFESLVVWIYWQYNKKFYFTRKNDATCYILDPFGEFKNLEQ